MTILLLAQLLTIQYTLIGSTNGVGLELLDQHRLTPDPVEAYAS